MYPKLNPEPLDIYFKEDMYIIPRKTLAAAYAGAMAAKNSIIDEMCPLLTPRSFKEHYDEAWPGCIEAANMAGLSATVETLEFFNPGKSLNYQIQDRLEHSDNPYYPFFEED